MRAYYSYEISRNDPRGKNAPLGVNAFIAAILSPRETRMTPYAYAANVHGLNTLMVASDIMHSHRVFLDVNKADLTDKITLGYIIAREEYLESVGYFVNRCYQRSSAGNVSLDRLNRKTLDAYLAGQQEARVDDILHIPDNERTNDWQFIARMYQLAIASFLESDQNKKALPGVLYISAMHMGKEIDEAIETVADEYLRQANITLAPERMFLQYKLEAYFANHEAPSTRKRILAALLAADCHNDVPEGFPTDLPPPENMTLEWARGEFGEEETDLLCRLLPVKDEAP